ncbi:unnamed protein product [Aureobasidium pullulans]|nr:unnamed protein product [Aureobasidium pullulans]
MNTNCVVCPPPASTYSDSGIRYKSHATKSCSGCNDIHYCSRTHQKDDWKIHRLICKKLGEAGERPSSNMRRVLFFPVDGTQPEFRWAPVEVRDQNGRNRPGECPIWEGTDLYADAEEHIYGCNPSCNDGTLFYHISSCHNIVISALGKRDPENAAVNKCVEQLTGGKVTHIKGDAIAFGVSNYNHTQNTTQDPPSQCIDMSTASLTLIKSFLVRNVASRQNIRGVRINCIGHIKLQNTLPFESVVIRSSKAQSRSSVANFHITRLLGLDLVGWQTTTEDGLDDRNPMASLLDITCSKRELVNGSLRWGYYRKQRWGNIVVMRSDGEPLGPEFMQALCTWIDKRIRPCFNKARAQIQLEKKRGDTTFEEDQARAARIEDIQDRTNAKITKEEFLEYHKGRLDDETDDEMPNTFGAEEETDDEE